MLWFGKSFIIFCKSFINLIKVVSTQTYSLARVRGGDENHPLLRHSPPPLPPFINAAARQRPHTRTYASHFLSKTPLLLSHDPPYVCALMNSLSIEIATCFLKRCHGL